MQQWFYKELLFFILEHLTVAGNIKGPAAITVAGKVTYPLW